MDGSLTGFCIVSFFSIFAGSNAYLGFEMDEAAVASAVGRVLTRDATADKEVRSVCWL